MAENNTNIADWSIEESENWLLHNGFDETVVEILCKQNKVDGKSLLSLNETDFAQEPLSKLPLGIRKNLFISCKRLQNENQTLLEDLGVNEKATVSLFSHNCKKSIRIADFYDSDSSLAIPRRKKDYYLVKFPAEKRKAFFSFCYVTAVSWISAFVMVIVHDRVPDMKKYPPLPDIFLDNVPHIPWAFDMCELTATVLLFVWITVLIFHKHRFILMRRFFALSGTVFLLRCITMLITSLSVPGAHLQCQPRNYSSLTGSVFDDLATKMSQAYVIWRGAGMSIQGVRTCGDYMFSGHTVALTMLNFFITEYTPRSIYYLHTLSWIMNMFGIFFILAAHEHYSIDVFVAFYISSRLFLYYHTLSNNQALMQRDSTRTKVWFPLFSYFESSVDGIVPNEYESLSEIVDNLYTFLKGCIIDLRQLNHVIVNAKTAGHAATNNVIESVSNAVIESKSKLS